MPLLTMSQMMQHAREKRYGIPSFNVWGIDSIKALQAAAEEEDAPVIIAGTEYRGKAIGGLDLWAKCALACAETSSSPMAVLLDHAHDFDIVVRCIRLGFTAVMIDASTLPYAENVAITRKVVEAAHAAGITAEAEIGHVGLGTEELNEDLRTQILTKPEDAQRFVAETGVDALAIAIGNLHGAYKFTPKIELDRLEKIARVCPAYLVLHGGSGTPDLDQAVRRGITKVNVGSDLFATYMKCMNGIERKEMFSVPHLAMKKLMIEYIRKLGANGQGKDLRRSLI